MHQIQRRLQRRRDRDGGGQFADDVLISSGRACRKNAKARLDAELFHNGFAGITGHV
jgi:hypothetical protein